MFAVACRCRSFRSGVGVEERIFCGPGVWPDMKMFAVACGCCSFSGGMVDWEPRGFLNANLCVNQYIKNVCDVFYNFCAEGHGHEVFRPQWRGETVDDALGSPSLPPASVLVLVLVLVLLSLLLFLCSCYCYCYCVRVYETYDPRWQYVFSIG